MALPTRRTVPALKAQMRADSQHCQYSALCDAGAVTGGPADVAGRSWAGMLDGATGAVRCVEAPWVLRPRVPAARRRRSTSPRPAIRGAACEAHRPSALSEG